MLLNSKILLTQVAGLNGIKSVSIHNSSFGELRVGEGYEVLITDCVFVGNKSKISDSTVKIKIRNSSLKMIECEFNGIHAFHVSILRAINSQVFIKSSIFSECDVKNSSLIFLNNSFLQLESSFAHNHGTCIRSDRNSTVIISQSDFTYNQGIIGSCLEFYTSHAVSVYESTFINNTFPTGGAIFFKSTSYEHQNMMSLLGIQNSIFTNNKAQIGGAIYVKGNINSTCLNNTFEDNRADPTWALGPHCGGAIYVHYGILKIMMCSFIKNIADYGGAVCVNNTLLCDVTKCRFEKNDAGRGGAFIAKRSRIKVIKSNFTDNKAYFGGALWLAMLSIHTQDLVFLYNTSLKGAAAYCTDLNFISINDTFYQNHAAKSRTYLIRPTGDAVQLISSTVTYQHAIVMKNTAEDVGGAFAIGDKSALILKRCTLIGNSGKNGGYIFANEFSTVSIINGTLAVNVGGVVVEVHSGLFIENTIFHNNSFHQMSTYSVRGSFYCKISISNSTFISEGFRYNGFLAGSSNTDIVLRNSVFKSPGCQSTSHSIFLSAGSSMNISNCEIKSNNQKCALFFLSNSAHLFINDIIISNYSWRSLAFLIDSHLHINNSTFSNNFYRSSSESYFIMASASHITLLNLSYFDSEFNTHVVLSESECQIVNCQFQNNRGGILFNLYGRSEFTIIKSEMVMNRGIMSSVDSTFVFNRCQVENNVGQVIGGVNSNATLRNCLITINEDDSMVELIYLRSNHSNYLDIRNTKFDANILKPEKTLINILNVTDIRIQDCNFTQTNGNHSGIINVTDRNTIRIEKSKLKATSLNKYFISLNITDNTTLELLTSKSEFVWGMEHRFTDKETFFSEAYESGIIRVGSYDDIKNFETGYASSKY